LPIRVGLGPFALQCVGHTVSIPTKTGTIDEVR
jgi:hypothetical protein